MAELHQPHFQSFCGVDLLSKFQHHPLVPASCKFCVKLGPMRSKNFILFFALFICCFTLFFSFLFRKFLVKNFNTWVSKTHFDLQGPWLPKTIWIAADPGDNHPYVSYRYTWQQKHSSKNAQIKISCLGHYRLTVNGERIYHGPEFAALPNIYVDSINIADYVKAGENQVEITCIYIDGITHEYPHYDKAAVLLGGFIQDGWWRHALGDYRLWEYAQLEIIEPKERLFNAGYVEDYDLTKNISYKIVSHRPQINYQIKDRPLSLLKYKTVNLKQLLDSGDSLVFDLAKFTPGYLKIISQQDRACNMNIIYGVELDDMGFPKLYMGQTDSITLPAGEITWEQISRRAGCYIALQGDCDINAIKLEFTQVYRDFVLPGMPEGLSELDKAIFELAKRSLEVNVQDQLEDSLVRERAMYLGDALAVSRCLLAADGNDALVKQAIMTFAQSQNSDGSFPSMAPSGQEQLIPEYALQWPVLLRLYYEKTQDKDFVKAMWPYLELVMQWAQDNTSDSGFFYNKNQNEKWWNFIDWSAVDKGLPYITAQQIWYLESLEATAKMAELTNHDAQKYGQQAAALKAALLEEAMNDQGLFVDSFADSGQKSSANLATNALAGKFDLFADQDKSKFALEQFEESGLYTYSPYSQTWVIEWALAAKEKDLTLELLRGYWGAMLEQGATSIFERFHPTESVRDRYDSYSHAWGCGPVWLYPELLESK